VENGVGNACAIYPECEPKGVGQGLQFPPEYLGGAFKFFEQPVSFETGEQVADLILNNTFGCDVTITKVEAVAIKALAATDSGTITVEKSDATTQIAQLTFAASAAIGNVQTSAALAVDVVKDDHVHLTTAKTTAGGKAYLTIWARRKAKSQ
jgi:hypothetical protein